jgi:hypothetical protein
VFLEVGDEVFPQVARHRAPRADADANASRRPESPDRRGGGTAYFKSLKRARFEGGTGRPCD